MLVVLVSLVSVDLPAELATSWNKSLQALEGSELELDVVDSRRGTRLAQKRILVTRASDSSRAFLRREFTDYGSVDVEFENNDDHYALAREGKGKPWMLTSVSKRDVSKSAFPFAFDGINNAFFIMFGGIGKNAMSEVLKTGDEKLVSAVKSPDGGYKLELEFAPRGDVQPRLKDTTGPGPYFPVVKSEFVAGSQIIFTYTFDYNGHRADGLPRLRRIIQDAAPAMGKHPCAFWKSTLSIKGRHDELRRTTI